MLKRISTLTRTDISIEYEYMDDIIQVKWKKTKFVITEDEIELILNKFFQHKDRWYFLGASFDQPIKGGLGEFIRDELKGLTPRHSSAIASILVNEGYLESKGKKPVYLKRN